VADQQRAETISAVLYPNDNLDRGKELRLKQQYFWCAASLSDIVRRFKKTKRSWNEFPQQVAIQLNDTHPTLAIPEFLRILIDIEGLEWDEAWKIVHQTFGYTNHTVLPEALEKWSVGLFQHLLPRHLQIIYDINLQFLQYVERSFPKDRELLSRVSIIEESNPKMIRMAYLALIGSHKVNGVAELHSDLIKTTIFKDFVKIYGPDKFTNVTNGITPRRWLHQSNPRLSALIASKLGGHDFLKDLTLLHKIEAFVDDKDFRKEWQDIKTYNKARLAKHVHETTGITLNPRALFDIQVKRIHEYKRQQLNIFGVIHRYLQIKALTAEERKKLVPRVSIFGGKAAPGYWMAKTVIHLINKVGDVINNDKDVGDLLKVVFIEDYNVSKAEVIVPASDISEHISTAGTEASGTSNMKFVLNGGLIIGTCDGANVSALAIFQNHFWRTDMLLD
jgi:starch phosphorylase